MAQPLNLESFIWACGAFCQLNRIPHDAALLIKQFPPPYDVVNLQQALQSVGLNNSVKPYSLSQLQNANLPCLAILKLIPFANTTLAPVNDLNTQDSILGTTTEQANESQASPTHGVALILRRDDQRLLVLQPKQAEPITVSIEDFTKQVTGDFLMVRKVEETVGDDGNHTKGIRL